MIPVDTRVDGILTHYSRFSEAVLLKEQYWNGALARANLCCEGCDGIVDTPDRFCRSCGARLRED